MAARASGSQPPRARDVDIAERLARSSRATTRASSSIQIAMRCSANVILPPGKSDGYGHVHSSRQNRNAPAGLCPHPRARGAALISRGKIGSAACRSGTGTACTNDARRRVPLLPYGLRLRQTTARPQTLRFASLRHWPARVVSRFGGEFRECGRFRRSGEERRQAIAVIPIEGLGFSPGRSPDETILMVRVAGQMLGLSLDSNKVAEFGRGLARTAEMLSAGGKPQ